MWQGWATGFPDSKATIESTLVSGNTVVLEVMWHGTHTGPLATPKGPIAATGKRIEWRACNVIEIDAEKGKAKMSRLPRANALVLAPMLLQVQILVPRPRCSHGARDT